MRHLLLQVGIGGELFSATPMVCCVPLGSAIYFPVEGRDLRSDPAMATAADLHNQIAAAKKTLEEKLDGTQPCFLPVNWPRVI